jgi:polar amino acid transport system substrate-binding protein
MMGTSSRSLAVVVAMAFAFPALAQVAVPAPARARASTRSRRRACCASACSPMRRGSSRTRRAAGDAWSGPAWILANEYAKRLGVKLEAVPVSHETKVPVLASNQVDISVTPLAETPDRLKVVDFVIYSTTERLHVRTQVQPEIHRR